MLSNRTYNVLKWVVVIVLPALTTLYGSLASVWQWPDTDAILTTMTAVTTFLGALIGVSTIGYNKGKTAGDE